MIGYSLSVSQERAPAPNLHGGIVQPKVFLDRLRARRGALVELDGDLPFPVVMRVEGGRVTGFYVDAPDGINARDLRFPFTHVAEFAAWSIQKSTGVAEPTVKEVRGRRGYPDDHYEMVAAMYRMAAAARPRDPVTYLAESLTVVTTSGVRSASVPTVRRWLRRAQDLGYLAPEERFGAGGTRPSRKEDRNG